MTDFLNSCSENECGCVSGCRCSICFGIVIFIFSTLAALGLGLILGISYTQTLAVALPALIASTIILAVLAIVTLIYRLCIRR